MARAQLKSNPSSEESVDSYNPVNGKHYKTYWLHSQEEANSLVEQSHQAFLEWRKTPLAERAKLLNRLALLLERDKTELAEMMARQMGKPVDLGKSEVDNCAAICRYTAETGQTELQDEEREIVAGKKGIITYQPLGVILGMQPWNFPLYQCIRYSSAVIMAGNTTVFKHASNCFETAEKIGQLYTEAGFPLGVFNVLLLEDEAVDELIGHPKIQGVTFTGSAHAGRIVARIAGENLKKNVMELGGSDAYLVLPDADINKAVGECVLGRTMNSGQTCIAAKRFLVDVSIYDEFKQKFVKAMQAVTYGDPFDPEVDMGPLARHDLRDKLHQQVKTSIEQGASCLCGGEIPDNPGAFYPATVLENIPENSPAYKEELFGPVACLFKVNGQKEAIRLANDHEYGLGGGVFSNNEQLAINLARNEMDTGLININGYSLVQPNMPFGGVKASGYGREHGGFGIKEFVNVKSILVS